MSARLVSYAVVFKTYAWDDFVLHQAQRCAAAAGRGDFYISVDETNGPVGPVPYRDVIRTSCAEMVSLGLANRFERGSLLWWNADYAHYHFLKLRPDYDFYIFVEYDVSVHTPFESIIEGIAHRGIDFVGVPIARTEQDWCWTAPHQQVYPSGEILGALICLSIFSQRALQALFARRLEMTRREQQLSYWPSAEAFLPTEVRRLGLQFASLEQFGDISRYNWSPPYLEADVYRTRPSGFLHPVCDSTRFLRRVRAESPDIWKLLDMGRRVSRSLLRHHPLVYAGLLAKAATIGGRSSLQRWWRSRSLGPSPS